ncbi:hypothetical protein HDC35_001080 [Sphingopyxis sp. JAI128]|nr:hypothetical protein [Sphingopyxis sp. JAI128]
MNIVAIVHLPLYAVRVSGRWLNGRQGRSAALARGLEI